MQHLISLEKKNIIEPSKLPLGPMSCSGTSSKEGYGKLGQFRRTLQEWLSWAKEPKSKRKFNM